MPTDYWVSRSDADAAIAVARKRITEALARVHVPWLLARTSLARFSHVGWRPVGERPLEGPLEYLTALAIKQGRIEQEGPCDAETADSVDTTLEEIWRLAAFAGAFDPSYRSPRDIAVRDTNTIRGEAAVTHLDHTFVGVFSELGDWVAERVGASPGGIVAVVDAVRTLVTGNIEVGVRAIASGSAAFVDNLLAGHGSAAARLGVSPRFLGCMASSMAVPDLLLWCYFTLAGTAIVDWFTVHPDEVAALTQMEASDCRRVLEFFVPDTAKLFASRYNSLDTTEITRKPLLTAGDRFFCPLVASLRRAPLRCLEHEVLAARDQSLADAFQTRRSRWLEREVHGLIARLVPRHRCHGPLLYEADDVGPTETDGIAVVGRHAFVFECKSGAFGCAAKSGDGARLEKTIRRNITEAWEQGRRVAHYMRTHSPARFRRVGTGRYLYIETAQIRHYHIVNPTLSQFGALAGDVCRERAAQDRSGGCLPWTVYINDLRSIAALCPTSSVFVDYVTKRTTREVVEKMHTSDELEVFMFYMHCRLLYDLSGLDAIVLDQFTDPMDQLFDEFTPDAELRAHVLLNVPDPVLRILRDLERYAAPAAQDLALLLLGAHARTHDQLASAVRHASARALHLPEGYSACAMKVGETGLVFLASTRADGSQQYLARYMAAQGSRLRTSELFGVVRSMASLGGRWVSQLYHQDEMGRVVLVPEGS